MTVTMLASPVVILLKLRKKEYSINGNNIKIMLKKKKIKFFVYEIVKLHIAIVMNR